MRPNSCHVLVRFACCLVVLLVWMGRLSLLQPEDVWSGIMTAQIEGLTEEFHWKIQKQRIIFSSCAPCPPKLLQSNMSPGVLVYDETTGCTEPLCQAADFWHCICFHRIWWIHRFTCFCMTALTDMKLLLLYIYRFFWILLNTFEASTRPLSVGNIIRL